MDSAVFSDSALFHFWMYCLLKANHRRKTVTVKTGRGATSVMVEAGQFIFGRKQAANDLNLPPSTIRNKLSKLVGLRKVGVQPDTHYSVITIINWDSYQADEKKEDRQEDRQRTGKGQAKDTNKNEENVKNDKNEPQRELIFTLPDWINENLWQEYMQVRTHLKAVNSPRAKNALINKLLKFQTQGHDPNRLIEIAIENSWKSVFLPRPDNGKGRVAQQMETIANFGGDNIEPRQLQKGDDAITAIFPSIKGGV